MNVQPLTFENVPQAITELLQKVQKIETLVEARNNEAPQLIESEPYIYGINGLAEFLKVSLPTAQKIKNSGKVPFSQMERTIIFKKVEVLEALSNNKRKKGGANA